MAKAALIVGLLTVGAGASMALAGEQQPKRIVLHGEQVRFCTRGLCAGPERWAQQAMRNDRLHRWAEQREWLLTVQVERLRRQLQRMRKHARRLQARQSAPITPTGWRAIDHADAWLCIHEHEGDWDANTGNGYYGGLQMDIDFQQAYGPELLAAKGTADNWTPDEQMAVAERAYDAGRGFYPWPNTARMCGLL